MNKEPDLQMDSGIVQEIVAWQVITKKGEVKEEGSSEPQTNKGAKKDQ